MGEDYSRLTKKPQWERAWEVPRVGRKGGVTGHGGWG